MSLWRFLLIFISVLQVYGDEPDISPRIVGGTTVTSATSYPYQVSLQTLQNQHFCGGSIIDRVWVLTAAHCVDGISPHVFKVVAGGIDLTSTGVMRRVSSIKVHQSYNNKFSSNDIALVRVVGAFAFTARVQAIKLADSLPAPGALATLTGWGQTSYNGVGIPTKLQALFVRVIKLSDCQLYLGRENVSNNNVCTLNTIGEGGCSGDSGGPIAYNGAQIGIVSFGVKCAAGYPDVDTSVPFMRKWISKSTGIKF